MLVDVQNAANGNRVLHFFQTLMSEAEKGSYEIVTFWKAAECRKVRFTLKIQYVAMKYFNCKILLFMYKTLFKYFTDFLYKYVNQV